MTLKITQVPSPNYSERPADSNVIATIIHYTAGNGAVPWFASPESKVSAHYVIHRDGTVTQCVPLDLCAWHAGSGVIQYGGNMLQLPNLVSFGIELENFGQLANRYDGMFFMADGATPVKYEGPAAIHARLQYDPTNIVEGYWEPFPQEQIDALKELIEVIGQQYPEAGANLLGHDEIAMPLGRKRDPGPAFPWDQFARVTPRSLKSIMLDGGSHVDQG